MNKKKLLQQARVIYITSKLYENKVRAWKVVVETQRKYEDIIFANDFGICEECVNEFRKKQIID